MSRKATLLAERRERLVALLATQRTILIQSISPWQEPLAVVDHGLAGLRFVKRHPSWLLAVGIVLAGWRPQQSDKWLGRT